MLGYRRRGNSIEGDCKVYARAGGEPEDIREDEAKQWPRISSCRRPAAVRIGKSPGSHTDIIIHGDSPRVYV